MTVKMDKLERHHYLKHYLGGPAFIADENKVATGQIEQVDLEDGSVLIKSGTESHWYDGKIVSPSLKHFRNLTTEDIHCIVDHLMFGGKRLSESEIVTITCGHHNAWEPNGCWEYGVFIHLLNDRIIWITRNWAVNGLKNLGTPDNIGQIIFLLCEMGFDVTGVFNQ